MQNPYLKLLSLILTVIMLVSSTPFSFNSIGAVDDSFVLAIYSEGSAVSEIVLQNTDKKSLEAVGLPDEASYQWQILVPSDNSWVNISDKTSDTCEVSVALIGSVLDPMQETAVRVVAAWDENTYVSEPVFIALDIDGAVSLFAADDDPSDDGGAETVDPIGEDPVDEFVYITIKYMINSNGNEVELFRDYVAKLRLGTSYSASVPSPTYPGYAPYITVDGVKQDASVINFNHANITQSVTYTVYYEPSYATYSVRYFLQNITDDLYTEATEASYTAQAITGTTPDFTKNFDGFSSLYHVPDKVAADSSTVFHVYYDRNYYLYNFDCNGGWGTEPVYARYGTNLIVLTPYRSGYDFAGWDLQVNDEYDGVADPLDTTIVNENKTYKAIWTPASTSFTIAYYKENPNDDGYTFWGYTQVEATAGDILSIGMLNSATLEWPVSGDCTGVDTSDLEYFTYNESLTKQKYYEVLSSYYPEGTSQEDMEFTVNGDGTSILNIYYSRNEYTLVFYDIYGTGYYLCGLTEGESHKHTDACKKDSEGNDIPNARVLYTITAKFRQDISDLWPGEDEMDVNLPNEYNHFWRWGYKKKTDGEDAKQSTKIYTMIPELCNNDNKHVLTLSGNWTKTARSWHLSYYFESLDQDSPANGTTRIEWKGKFYDYDEYYYEELYSLADYFGNKAITYFTSAEHGKETSSGDDYYENLFYDRNEYSLSFRNNGVIDESRTELIKHGTDISDRNYIPSYPPDLEVGAYEFDGWYTTARHLQGTEFDFTGEDSVMPPEDIILYAKWAPISHTVTFSNSYDDLIEGNYIDDKSYSIDHNELVPTSYIPKAIPSIQLGSGILAFIGWFYIDESGSKHAFDPGTMPVLTDMHLYAEYQSTSVRSYTVRYVDEETGIDIIEPFSGYTYVGLTKTFAAKTADELGQEHYYPDAGSKSILMKDISSENTVTFYYKHIESVNYTVRYVNKTTGTELQPPKSASTSLSVLTEKYLYIEGYLSDAFYKRIILSSDESQNEITFYYTLDSDHVRYAVKHLVQDIGKDSYSEYAVIEGLGTVNDEITIDTLDITGFTYDYTIVQEGENTTGKQNLPAVTKTLALNRDLVVCFYYKRNQSQITVHFVEFGDPEHNDLKDPVTLNGEYGETTLYSDAPSSIIKEIEGQPATYLLMSNQSHTVTFNENNDQVLYIYYTAKEVVINFIPVCMYATTSFGTVSPESVKASITGQARSTPHAAPGYVFVGWYADEECMTPIDKSLWDNESNTLQLNSLPDEMTDYFALFEPIKKGIKIVKTGVNDADKKQTFLFSVVGQPEEGGGVNAAQNVNMTVAVTPEVTDCANIVDLPLGTYKITELTSWSWQYDADIEEKTVVLADDSPEMTEITFNNSRNSDVWLGSENYNDNTMTKVP